jgi:hypothetical protein
MFTYILLSHQELEHMYVHMYQGYTNRIQMDKYEVHVGTYPRKMHALAFCKMTSYIPRVGLHV